jgi:tetratricopeptide (TPR) repeat protein
MAYLKLKNYNQVVDDANAALKIDSKYLKAYHRRGKAYFELRKYDQAIKDF